MNILLKKSSNLKEKRFKFNRKPYKFCKESTDESILDNLKKFEFSSTIIDYFEKYGTEIHQGFKTLKDYIHELIIIRNKIFTLLKQIDDFQFDKEIYNFAESKDHSNFSKLLVHFKGSKYLSPFILWNIPKKTTEFDEFIDNQLENDEQ